MLTNLNSRHIAVKELLVLRPSEENIFGFNSQEAKELPPWSSKVNSTFTNKSNLKRWWSYIWDQIPPKRRPLITLTSFVGLNFGLEASFMASFMMWVHLTSSTMVSLASVDAASIRKGCDGHCSRAPAHILWTIIVILNIYKAVNLYYYLFSSWMEFHHPQDSVLLHAERELLRHWPIPHPVKNEVQNHTRCNLALSYNIHSELDCQSDWSLVFQVCDCCINWYNHSK